jgi:hypothetical protein
MGKPLSRQQSINRGRARRDTGLRRKELDGAEPIQRAAPVGVTSPAVKVADPRDRALIDAFLARRAGA